MTPPVVKHWFGWGFYPSIHWVYSSPAAWGAYKRWTSQVWLMWLRTLLRSPSERERSCKNIIFYQWEIFLVKLFDMIMSSWFDEKWLKEKFIAKNGNRHAATANKITMCGSDNIINSYLSDARHEFAHEGRDEASWFAEIWTLTNCFFQCVIPLISRT